MTVKREGDDVDIDAIHAHIKEELRIRGLDTVPAVEAAHWLAEAGLFKDSPHRPGLERLRESAQRRGESAPRSHLPRGCIAEQAS